MSVPKSVIRIKRNGVEYVSNCDRAQYTIRELTRAALRDVGKLISFRANEMAQALHGMEKSERVRKKTSAFQYWVRKRECDLQVGIKHNTWYGVEQELGSSRMKKLGILTNATQKNIAEIIKIESQYLSALEDEAKALEMIDEGEHEGGADE